MCKQESGLQWIRTSFLLNIRHVKNDNRACKDCELPCISQQPPNSRLPPKFCLSEQVFFEYRLLTNHSAQGVSQSRREMVTYIDISHLKELYLRFTGKAGVVMSRLLFKYIVHILSSIRYVNRLEKVFHKCRKNV